MSLPLNPASRAAIASSVLLILSGAPSFALQCSCNTDANCGKGYYCAYEPCTEGSTGFVGTCKKARSPGSAEPRLDLPFGTIGEPAWSTPLDRVDGRMTLK